MTDGIYKDQNVIFDRVTPEWKTFCDEVLKFEVPEYARDTGEANVAKQ